MIISRQLAGPVLAHFLGPGCPGPEPAQPAQPGPQQTLIHYGLTLLMVEAGTAGLLSTVRQ